MRGTFTLSKKGDGLNKLAFDASHISSTTSILIVINDLLVTVKVKIAVNEMSVLCKMCGYCLSIAWLIVSELDQSSTRSSGHGRVLLRKKLNGISWANTEYTPKEPNYRTDYRPSLFPCWHDLVTECQTTACLWSCSSAGKNHNPSVSL